MKVGDMIMFVQEHWEQPGIDYVKDWVGLVIETTLKLGLVIRTPIDLGMDSLIGSINKLEAAKSMEVD